VVQIKVAFVDELSKQGDYTNGDNRRRKGASWGVGISRYESIVPRCWYDHGLFQY